MTVTTPNDNRPPHDEYASRSVGGGRHVHPWLTQRTIDLAKKVVTSKKHRDITGRPMRLAYDSVLRCCGLRVSTLVPGETYPDADR